MFKKLGGILKKVGVPLLGAVAGGPAGMATTAATMISSVLNANPDNEDDLVAALEKATPEQIVQLKRIELDNKVELEKLAVERAHIEAEREKAHLHDREDARDRELEFLQRTGKRDWSHTGLAWLICAGYFSIVFCFIFADFSNTPIAVLNIITQLVGTLTAAFIAVAAYHFGSSVGSKQKQDAINIQNLKKEKAGQS